MVRLTLKQWKKRAAARKGLKRYQMGLKRRRGGFAPSIHNIKEKCEVSAITAGASSSSNGVLNCSLSQLTNAGPLSNMYDLYKIVGWKVTFVPQWNVSQIGQSVSGSPGFTSGLPVLFVAPNRSPYCVAPSSVADILNDDGVRMIRLTRPVSMYMKYPKPLFEETDISGNVKPYPIGLFNNNIQPWLSTGGNSQIVNQSGTYHNGFRYFLDNANFAGSATVRVFYTLYIKLKEQD